MPPIARVRTVFTGVPGTPWYSNTYWNLAGAASTGVRLALKVFWDDVAEFIDDSVDFTVESDVTIIESTTGQVVDVTTGGPVNGAGVGAGEPLPRACQFLLNLTTGDFVNGRRLQGKMYLPGFIASTVTEGVFNAATITDVQTAANDLLESTGDLMVVYSPTHLTYDPVQAITANELVAILRSRRD